MLNSNSSAETGAEQRTEADNTTSSHNNGNALVGGSLLGQREIKFKYIFKTYDGRFIVEYFTLKELEYGGLQNFLFGLHDITIVAKRQYTGLKDKNGKEIYEGDILRTETNKPMVVGWSNKFASFVLERDGWAFQHWFGEAADPEYCEIIGNIFANPELLETLR